MENRSAEKKKSVLPASTLALAAVCLTAGLSLFSCASAPIEPFRPPDKPVIWPAPPEQARISFLKTIERPEDIGARQGFFRRLADIVLGAEDDDIVKPYGLATDSTGRLLVADTAFKRLHVYDLFKGEYASVDSAGKARLEAPIGVALDAEDNIYVTDSGAAKVFVYGKDADFLFQITGFKRPTGIAVDKAEKRLYVVDTSEHAIKIFDLKGNPAGVIGRRGEGAGEFNYPVDISIDKDGNLYVNDAMNFRVQIFDRTGRFRSAFGRHGDGTGDIGRPKGLAVDSQGNIYIADAVFDTVQIFDRDGRFLLNFGKLGREQGRFWLPTGLHIDSKDRVYVSDSYNKRVQVFEYLGSKKAGEPGATGIVTQKRP